MRRARDVRLQYLRVGGVDGGALDGAAEQPLRVRHEVLVQRAVECHVVAAQVEFESRSSKQYVTL